MHVLVDGVSGVDERGAGYVRRLVEGLASSAPQPTWTLFVRTEHDSVYRGLRGDRVRVFPVDGVRTLWREWGLPRFMRTGREVLLAPRNRAALRWGGPQLLVVSDLSPLSPPFREEAGGAGILGAPFRRLGLAAGLRAVDLSVVHGTEAMALLRRRGFFLDRTRIVAPGVEEAFFADGGRDEPGRADEAEPPYVLSPGPVVRRKRIGVQLQAIAALRSAGRELALRVVGPVDDPGYRARLEDEAARQGVGDLLHFDPVDDIEGLARLYRNAGALLLTSEAEGFPLAVVRAMAAGIPVVTSREIETRELCGELARAVSGDDPAAVAAALREAVAGGDLQEKARAVGPPMARPFLWSRVGREWIWLLRAAVARKFGRKPPDPDTVPDALTEGDEPTVPADADAVLKRKATGPDDRRSRRR